MLLGLCRVCLLQMRARRLPGLYSGAIKYKREAPGKDVWQTAIETARLGSGDCEDLVAYRVAELWLAGQRAAPVVVKIRPGLMHCRVRTARGNEDPSVRLGMK